MNDYTISSDCIIIRRLLHLSQTELASYLGVTMATVNRLEQGEISQSDKLIESLYSFAYDNPIRNLRLNALKKDFHKESHPHILFHGSRNGIEGEITPFHSERRIDFGNGFYCGESYEQASSFIAPNPKGSVYVYECHEENLKVARYKVDEEWMLAILYFRGRLDKYEDHPKVRAIEKKASSSDVIIAPIANNLMYDVMRSFGNGDLTDLQAVHALSASSLGYQHVYKSEVACASLKLLEHLYVPMNEKKDILKKRDEEREIAITKVAYSKERYRREGRYIEEIFR